MSHSGYNPRRQISTTQGYKRWSHGMTNVTAVSVSIRLNISIKLSDRLFGIVVSTSDCHPRGTRFDSLEIFPEV